MKNSQKKTTQFVKNKLPIIILFLIAGVMRVFNWNHLNTLAGDEGVQLLTAEHFIKYKVLPTVGEISALDTKNQYLMHNSPLGYYFISLVYLLGFKTAEGYVLIFVFLNLIQAYLLYQAAKSLWGKQAGMTALVLALFSHSMIHASIWTSQPVIAVFFESIALFLAAKFIKKRKDKFFIASSLVSLLATQFYPPMYLLLPIKIGLYCFGFKKIKKKKQTMALTLMGAILIYLPLLQIELKYDWINFQTLNNYLQNPDFTITEDSFGTRLVVSFKKMLKYIFPTFFSQTILFFIILGGIISEIYSMINQKLIQKKIVGIFLLWFSPILFLAIVFKNPHLMDERAYLFIAIPFLLLWLGALLSRLNKKLFIPITVFLIFFLIFYDLKLVQNNSSFNHIEKTNITITAILENTKQKKLQLTDIDLLAISNYDPYGWETSFYWYVLEKITHQYLVDIDMETSKAKRKSNTSPKVLYIICHDVQDSFTKIDCLNSFEKYINEKYYQEKFILKEVIDSPIKPIMVMHAESKLN